VITMRGRGSVAVVLAAIAVGACSEPTQLVVVVDSDLGDALTAVAVEASVNGGAAASHRFEVAETGIPFSFVVAPGDDDDANAPVAVRVTAVGEGDASGIRYHVRTRFLEGRSLRLDAPLSRRCLMEPPCHDLGMRCWVGECLPEEVEPASLPDASGDARDPIDALASDAGPPLDAGPPPDGGGCAEGAECRDPMNPCRVGAMVCDGDEGPDCEIQRTLDEGADCGEGRTCDGAGMCRGS